MPYCSCCIKSNSDPGVCPFCSLLLAKHAAQWIEAPTHVHTVRPQHLSRIPVIVVLHVHYYIVTQLVGVAYISEGIMSIAFIVDMRCVYQQRAH